MLLTQPADMITLVIFVKGMGKIFMVLIKIPINQNTLLYWTRNARRVLIEEKEKVANTYLKVLTSLFTCA